MLDRDVCQGGVATGVSRDVCCVRICILNTTAKMERTLNSRTSSRRDELLVDCRSTDAVSEVGQ